MAAWARVVAANHAHSQQASAALDPQLTERQRAAKYGDRQDRVWLDGEYALFAQHYPHIQAYWERREARRLLKAQREARRLEWEQRRRPVLVVVND
jgi:hypothetical protein